MIAIASERTAVVPSPVRDGIRHIMPGVVGVLPFAVMIGVAVGESPLDDLVGYLGGLAVAGGSAHLAVAGSIAVGTGFVVTVLTALLINSRTLIYGAAVAPVFRSQPAWFRWVASYGLVDQMYALTTGVADRDDEYVRSYYVAAMSTLWGAYMAGVGAGIILGPVMPAWLPLSLAIPVLFLVMLVPAVGGKPARTAALVGAGAAVLGAGLPAGVGLVLAIVAGTSAAAFAEGRADA